MKEHIEAAKSEKEMKERRLRMEKVRDSSIVRYGMITVRADRVIIGQKLEKERSPGQKWDIYDLIRNNKIERLEYGEVKGR